MKLNVGGIKYTTSLSTLTAVPDTYFTSVFSEDWQLMLTPEGEVFVDRDGEGFRHALQYLRTARTQQPFIIPRNLDPSSLLAPAIEAEFYGLTAGVDSRQNSTGLQAAVQAAAQPIRYKYKYIRIDTHDGHSSTHEYAPHKIDRKGRIEDVAWVKAAQADTGSLVDLKRLNYEGWEVWQSCIAAK